MAVAITIDDLRPFEPTISQDKAEAMITGAVARAALVAPCILDDDFPELYAEAVRSILVRAILRWNTAGAGNVSSVTTGPFAETYVTSNKELYWPSELAELQNVCRAVNADGENPSTATPTWFMDPQWHPELRWEWMNELVDP